MVALFGPDGGGNKRLLIFGGDVFEGGKKSKSLHLSPLSWELLGWALCPLLEINSWELMFFHPSVSRGIGGHLEIKIKQCLSAALRSLLKGLALLQCG